MNFTILTLGVLTRQLVLRKLNWPNFLMKENFFLKIKFFVIHQLTSNFLKTRFFQKAHFKDPWKARSKGLANDESKNLLLISPGLLSEKVEVEEKSAQPQLFDQGHLQFYRNLFFEKIDIMHLWRALSTCLANMQSNVILLVLPGLHSEKIECELKKVPNPNFLQWLTSNFLKTPFFKKLILCITGER